MRLIDADNAVERVRKAEKGMIEGTDGRYHVTTDAVIAFIEMQDDADLISALRDACKSCDDCDDCQYVRLCKKMKEEPCYW